MKIEGRVALVTGGGRRVGRAIALGLAGAGADVAVHFHRSEADAAAVAAEVEAMGRRAVTVAGDLADPAVPPALVGVATAGLGPVTILVNSASGFPEDTLEDITPEAFAATHAVTLAAPVFLTREMVAAMPQGLSGAVVNVGDVRTASPYRKRFSYIVAKGGLDTFTRAAALALAPRVRVNAVALGVILPPGDADDDYALRLAADLPLARSGGTDPVVHAVIALIENDFVTGEIVRVDGGGHLV